MYLYMYICSMSMYMYSHVIYKLYTLHVVYPGICISTIYLHVDML